MLRIWLFGFIIVLFSACREKAGEYTISGSLQNNKYDGEIVYLVPLKGANQSNVDSTIIKDGKFSFEGKVDSVGIFILRTRPLLRFKLEEILIVKEPGTVLVNFGEDSFATGTALNDSLQKWKDHKKIFAKTSYALSESGKNDNNVIIEKMETLKSGMRNYYTRFIIYNSKNIVGKSVFQFVKDELTEEQIIRIRKYLEDE
ncbi:MAG: hypothetical protein PWQ06_569 [Anaerophaga sp.]|nr:hypothetical protein [Anaerophaga sp.]